MNTKDFVLGTAKTELGIMQVIQVGIEKILIHIIVLIAILLMMNII